MYYFIIFLEAIKFVFGMTVKVDDDGGWWTVEEKLHNARNRIEKLPRLLERLSLSLGSLAFAQESP